MLRMKIMLKRNIPFHNAFVNFTAGSKVTISFFPNPRRKIQCQSFRTLTVCLASQVTRYFGRSNTRKSSSLQMEKGTQTTGWYEIRSPNKTNMLAEWPTTVLDTAEPWILGLSDVDVCSTKLETSQGKKKCYGFVKTTTICSFSTNGWYLTN